MISLIIIARKTRENKQVSRISKKDMGKERYSKGQLLEYITYRQKKQKPQIDFLRFQIVDKVG